VVAGVEPRPNVDLELGGRFVDVQVSVDDRMGQLGVPVEKGPGGASQRFTHEPKQAEDGLLDYLRHGGKR
jgi:hypothetical protein